jgi:prepilin-type N-terminal cleavage/methylation domain-containing protein
MSRHNLNTGNAHGYSLLELIIVISVFSMLMLVLSNFAINGFNNYNYLQAQANTSADLNNQIGRVSRVIRGTTGIVSATGNDLTIYGYFSPRDDKIHYYITGGTTLVADVTPATGTAPNYTYSSTNTTSHTITTKLTTSPAPVFTYYDSSGTQLGSGFGLTDVKQIGILLSSNPKPNRLPAPITISTTVTLRNMKTNL